ncbi:hypothetical protein GCM10010435_31860 [Winogradskya consettensis]|uniref:ESX-1 secretion-associated protein n=1 Tax=Winogradskya consettensis TaxID=113560 RepID=A0A919SEG2_9ACTN|nr:hypothetical protein [Actinoplanes consettensis]GIM70321.1 hypothetical protein Aco04nite_19640 [Actinoplanes consettensis]
MAADGLQMPIDAVRGHAATVDNVGAAMEQARGAVHEVTMDTGAFGQLCQFLPAILSPVFGMVVDALDGSIDALHETADGLRATADGASVTDENTAKSIGSTLKLPL